MKKIRLLTSLVGLTGLSMGLVPAIASCSCSEGLQVELASKTTERNFDAKTGGSAWLFKTANAEIAKSIKVKITNLKVDGSEATSVAGLIKTSYDSAGNIKVVVKTDILLTQWPSATKFEFGLSFTYKSTNQSTTIDGFILNLEESSVKDFTTCGWDFIVSKTNAYYNGDITKEELIASFGNSDLEPFTQLSDFVGLETTLKINGLDHKVIIIDTEHDTLTTPAKCGDTKALFTFEIMDVLTASDGTVMKSKWDLSKCYDYTNSVLRWNLNGAGSGTKPSSDLWDTSFLDLLKDSTKGDPVLAGAIKQVKKEVAKSTDSGVNFSVQSYDDYLFPLTLTEMGQTYLGPDLPEGTAYTYHAKHTERNYNLKYDVKKTTGFQYWLSTPDLYEEDSRNCAVYVSNVGRCSYQYATDVSNENAVAPAFCI